MPNAVFTSALSRFTGRFETIVTFGNRQTVDSEGDDAWLLPTNALHDKERHHFY